MIYIFGRTEISILIETQCYFHRVHKNLIKYFANTNFNAFLNFLILIKTGVIKSN